jgi:hypothetical protein
MAAVKAPDLPETANHYPGANATAREILLLAGSYHKSAQILAQRKGDAISRAPCRFLALHAIELYLNALLRHRGHAPDAIRGMQHDVSKRMDLVVSGGLTLRKRTMEHMAAIAAHREYLVMRYGDIPATIPQINRLMATMEELAEKVSLTLNISPPIQPAALRNPVTTGV